VGVAAAREAVAALLLPRRVALALRGVALHLRVVEAAGAGVVRFRLVPAVAAALALMQVKLAVPRVHAVLRLNVAVRVLVGRDDGKRKRRENDEGAKHGTRRGALVPRRPTVE
jgi:hypothetical protein